MMVFSRPASNRVMAILQATLLASAVLVGGCTPEQRPAGSVSVTGPGGTVTGTRTGTTTQAGPQLDATTETNGFFIGLLVEEGEEYSRFRNGTFEAVLPQAGERHLEIFVQDGQTKQPLANLVVSVAVTTPDGQTVTADLPYLYSREGPHYGANLPIGDVAGRYTVAVTVRPTEQFGAHEPNPEWAKGVEVELTYERT
jgi:Fe2+ transport protein